MTIPFYTIVGKFCNMYLYSFKIELEMKNELWIEQTKMSKAH